MPELPDPPNLAKRQEQAWPATPAVQPVPIVGAVAEPEVTAVEVRLRYWTEDRIMRIAMVALFVVFAVGLVWSLAEWEVLAKAPFLPWLAGIALVAGPAWKSYAEHAEEAKGRRVRAEQAKTGYGVNVPPVQNRNTG